MITDPKILKTIKVPKFVNKIPTAFNVPLDVSVYGFIRDILFLKGVTVKSCQDSTEQCNHIVIKNGKKVLFEYMNSFINDRACIYTGKGDLVAVDNWDSDCVYYLDDKEQSRKPNYMELLSDLLYRKANASRKNLYIDNGWFNSQPRYKTMIDYVIPILQSSKKR